MVADWNHNADLGRFGLPHNVGASLALYGDDFITNPNPIKVLVVVSLLSLLAQVTANRWHLPRRTKQPANLLDDYEGRDFYPSHCRMDTGFCDWYIYKNREYSVFIPIGTGTYQAVALMYRT